MHGGVSERAYYVFLSMVALFCWHCADHPLFVALFAIDKHAPRIWLYKTIDKDMLPWIRI